MTPADLARRASAFAGTFSAIVDYLRVYGVPEERARGAAADIMSEELSDIIGQGGTG